MTADVTFAYDVAVSGRYPTLATATVTVTGITNGPPTAELADAFTQAQRAATDLLNTTSVADLPSIAAWRRTFSSFGTKPTQYRSAPEALLRRLASGNPIPSIDLLVDIGNTISIQHAMPVAVFDLDRLSAPITVRFADGTETFIAVGSGEQTIADSGEVIFQDATGIAIARRWCWRQGSPAATKPDTTRALYVIEALHDSALHDVTAAATNLATLLKTHAPNCNIHTGTL